MYRNNSEIDMNQFAEFLQNAVSKVKGQEDPDLLNSLKKVYKQNVPFSLRLYVAAYLAKEASKSFKGNFRSNKRDFYENKNRTRTERPVRERKPAAVEDSQPQEERQPRPRVQIDPELASTIFISIGKNRHVFPRDLVGMLVSAAGIDRDRIGDIRVLANYSFVQLFKEDAEKAISVLNGYEYRGRKLIVSYSHVKDESEEAVSQEDSTEEMQSAEDAAAYAAAEKAAAGQEPFGTPHLMPDAGQPEDFQS